MSTIYTDAAGNKYLGDCRWGNHDINYPTTSYLQGYMHDSDLSASITNALSQSGLQYNSVLPQATWDSMTSQSYTLFNFSPAGESYASRFRFEDIGYTSANTFYDSGPRMLNNSGSTIVKPVSQSLYRQGYAGDRTLITHVACFNNISAAYLISNASPTLSKIYYFMYAGRLYDVNTNFDYYNNETKNSILLAVTCYSNSLRKSSYQHYINTSSKALLETGRAAYTISCSDGQTPGSQWATDMWVYDNNAALGYPVIGRVPNMLLGIGTYTYLKPVKIEGSVFPDGGSPWYLPVGTFAGKTLLMRCYSSVS